MQFPSEFSGYIGLLLFGGFFFIFYGLIYIFSKNFVWRVQAFFSRIRRKNPPERTPEWNRRTTASGVAAILFGLFAVFFALFLPMALASLQQTVLSGTP
jgi:hypothetical protein